MQTHALWLQPVVFVLLMCVKHSSSASFRLIVLHKLGTRGRIGVLVCTDSVVDCVDCVGCYCCVSEVGEVDGFGVCS